MKTLLLTNVFPPMTGGSGRWFHEIYRRLPREEYVIAAGDEPRAAEFDRTHDLDLVRVPLRMSDWGIASTGGLRRYWEALRAVRRIVRERGIERVHAGALLPDGWLAWLLGRLTGRPYLCYVHGEELSYGHSSRQLGWMMRRVLSGAAVLIANSRNTARILREDWHVEDGRIRVLHPGVDTRRFAPHAADVLERERLGWSGRKVILTVGRLQARKGHDLLIEALPAIRERVPDVLYAILGDGGERERLRSLVAERRLEGHVQFQGELDDEQLVRCYQQCDLFVLPNRAIGGDIEGFGMVLLEAQACGKPVIAGNTGGTAETMRIPQSGWTVDSENLDELAGAVAELLSDADRREAMGRAARDWVVSTFDWTPLARQAQETFEALTAATATPAPSQHRPAGIATTYRS